ncbi:hypothetical protein DFS33DRAFT_373818 [Desarmillaria ectypa]|nr:hypothetical protein DFS33DRAFT_373818 [Desarmillaria ectypa]
MKLEDFTAGVNQLRHLLNPDKRGQYRPKEISRYLKDSTPFLQKILKLSRDDKTHPAASFARDLLYTCDSIAAELPPNLQLPIFDSWELWMRERSSCVKLEEDTPLPAAFLPVLSKPRGRKRQAPPVEDSGNDNAPGNNNEEGKATSDKEESGGNDGDEDNDGGEADESERETLPKVRSYSPFCVSTSLFICSILGAKLKPKPIVLARPLSFQTIAPRLVVFYLSLKIQSRSSRPGRGPRTSLLRQRSP